MDYVEHERIKASFAKGLASENMGDLYGALDIYDNCIYYCSAAYDKDRHSGYFQEMLRIAEYKVRVLKALRVAYGSDNYDYSDFAITRDAWLSVTMLGAILKQANNAKKLIDNGKPDEAIVIYDDCIKKLGISNKMQIRRKAVLLQASCMLDRAAAYQAINDLASFRVNCEAAIALLRTHIQRDGMQGCNQALASIQKNYACSLESMGRRSESLELINESIEMWEAQLNLKGSKECALYCAYLYIKKGDVMKSMGDDAGGYDAHQKGAEMMKLQMEL